MVYIMERGSLAIQEHHGEGVLGRFTSEDIGGVRPKGRKPAGVVGTVLRQLCLGAEKFLKNDGTIVTAIVPSIAPPRTELAKMNATFREGSQGGMTVKSFLSSNAIRATNSMDERQINLCSSNNSTPCMLPSVTVPLLIAAMQASFQNLVQELEINYSYA